VVTVLGVIILIPLDVYNWKILFLLVVCYCYQIYIIFPYTPLSPKQVLDAAKGRNSLKIISCNVFMHNRNSKLCLSEIERLDPDLVLLVETDKWWFEQLQVIQQRYPYQVTVPLSNTYGMLLYSKLELIDKKVEYLVEKEVPSIHTVIKVHQDLQFKLHCLHPAPPSPTENESSTERDAELLLVAKRVDATRIPTIVVGDLNDVAWSSTTKLFQKVSGLLDPRIGRGFFNTFHASYPIFRWPLDHIFHSNHFRLVDIIRLKNIGSDHFPMYVELTYDYHAPKVQPEPDSELEDIELAKEKIKLAF
jgi:endonuclease/exonuclease/phosphatase (EEP) superfamily protein YafD